LFLCIKVSIRTVPNQNPEILAKKVATYCKEQFSKIQTGNRLSIETHSLGDYWSTPTTAVPNMTPVHRLGLEMLDAARGAVSEHWGQMPCLTREGGTVAALSFLAEALDAPLIQIPFGQRTDQVRLFVCLFFFFFLVL
jgi:hypothetical protein